MTFQKQTVDIQTKHKTMFLANNTVSPQKKAPEIGKKYLNDLVFFPGYLQFQVDTSYTVLVNVSTQDWHANVYYERVVTGPATFLDCSNECLNVERTTCELFVFDQDHNSCFLGQMSHTSGSISGTVPEGSVTIYGVKCEHTMSCTVLTSYHVLT